MMKKVLILLGMLVLITACGKEVDLVGSWVSSDNATYQFNSDGTCLKTNSVNMYSCTYTKENGVVNIYLKDKPNEVYESGQINPDRIIIGSDVYKKGE